MEEKSKVSPKEQNNSPRISTLDSYYKIARLVLVVLLVVALGLYCINAAIDYRFKVEFVKSPCALCAELNQNQSQCINGCFTYEVTQFPDGFGGWRNSTSTALPVSSFNLSALQ